MSPFTRTLLVLIPFGLIVWIFAIIGFITTLQRLAS